MDAKRPTVVGLFAFAAGLVFVVLGFLAVSWQFLFSSKPPSVQISTSVESKAPAPQVTRTTSLQPNHVAAKYKISLSPENQQAVEDLNQELAGSKADQDSAIAELNRLAEQDPKTFTNIYPSLIQPLLGLNLYDQVEKLSAAAISQRPQTSIYVADEQRSIVQSLLAQGKYDQALPAAKSYYNAVTLRNTADAVDLFAQALEKCRGQHDPTIGTRFRIEQSAGAQPSSTAASNNEYGTSAEAKDSGPDGKSILDSVTIDNSNYESDISATRYVTQGWSAQCGRGNLLLLADRPVEARQCFTSACEDCRGDESKLHGALEGIARALRAQTRNIEPANAFIRACQQGAINSLPKALNHVAPEQLQAVAHQIKLASIPSVRVPALEQQRQQRESTASLTPPIQIETFFECSVPLSAVRETSTHIIVHLTSSQFRDWFMFRLKGLSGQIVRVDIVDDEETLERWWSLNPVYTYATDLDAFSTYDAAEGTGEPISALNGSSLPATDEQRWHYISDVWMSRPNTLSFVQRFDSDAYLAMRVPYTPGYNQNWFKQLASNPNVKVVEVGRSVEGRPLLLAQIGSNDDIAGTRKPCVVAYAGEHADEHDAMWVANGIIQYLIRDSEDAAQLRKQFTFLVIPMLDPDSTNDSIHSHVCPSFLSNRCTTESNAYADWFQAWVNSGKRIDLVLDFHNVQASESTNVKCALLEGDGDRGHLSSALHRLIIDRFSNAGYTTSPAPMMRGWSPDRLGGWLSHYYGAFTLAYEVNSQSIGRHLNIRETQQLGAVFVEAGTNFMHGASGTLVIDDVDSRRQQRLMRWKGYESIVGEGAILSEARRAGGDISAQNDLIKNAIY